ncbi:MAG: protocatechuate 3,4-dioxygenase [Betaproteobacteria bacterium]|nr:MAG: protocatechuate 3,4-dioxygenase [Betaproteobacteria bacterium]
MSNVTSSQTIGPFFHNALAWAFDSGSGPIELVGRVLDGSDQPVSDAMVEIWADGATGKDGFGLLRQPTDEAGQFRFRIPAPHPSAPLAHVCVFARGCFNQHFTAVFPSMMNHRLLTAAPESRRATLVAAKEGDHTYRWDLCLQGARETVFFEYE